MIEGSNVSKFAQLIRNIGFNDYDQFELATVVSPPPSLRIQIDNMKVGLDATDVVVAEHLTDHERVVSLKDGPDTAGTSGESSGPSYLENALLAIKSPLQAGDRVIVASANNGQTYVILDKAVKYSGS
ncbi:hypothetical protein SK3146_03234 [Paenibacillus konkukensis]|uniref:DUF2577 domain-containing protein n=1 Tax=Paenibacillus konkukensis TaxID=2020716 RepID=A0ABY4RRL9_9BACL|nr:DUF2577 domain-containing protein [Paenibacillus konkukensis]UQZ84022.1 hypothetical protein SK3146_03234 [Paenibacillus konkukensis]